MKKLLTLICVAALSCNSRNDKMNSLLSEKSKTEKTIDSLTSIAEHDDNLSKTKDTVISNKYMRSSFRAGLDARKEREKLKSIEYSIDSLSKLR